MTGLQARDLEVALGGRMVLDGVSARLRPGELVGLIGPNGAGKTTLLGTLAGLTRPDRGQVSLDGRPLAGLPPAERARRLAFLDQQAGSHWPLRVERVVTLGRLPHADPWRGSAGADAAAVERAMARCGVSGLRDRVVTTLSGGERARVMLARALAVEPDYLLADEPAAGLDPYHQLQLMELLAGLAAEGMGVMVVLHELALALRFCTRLCLMAEGGAIVADSDPTTLLAGGRLEDVYAIELLRGVREGQPYALAWRRADAADMGGSRG